jgi:ppGpp synthetase/RelA/SpoT-type nucleotidyltranferase
MAGGEGPEETKRASVESVLSEFEGKKELLGMFCAKAKSLIEECLDDAKIRYQSVQARVKAKKKLRDKYSNPEKNYGRLDDITDLVGLRIITYYEDEVDLAAEVIRREFEIDLENSADRRNSEPDRFSYHAINYVCHHSAQRLGSVEYRRFSGLRCEIQITSILRHAWSEIEHDWYDLRDAFPAEIKRRFYRMAALLEVAESEFLELRKRRSDYQRSIAVRIEANVSGLALDSVSLRSLIEQDALVASIDQAVSVARGYPVAAAHDYATDIASKMAGRAGLKTIEDLRSSLKRYEQAIPEYVERCRPYLPNPSGAVLPSGACVFFLSVMLVGLESELSLSQAFKEVGYEVPNPTALSAIARTVAGKYPG